VACELSQSVLHGYLDGELDAARSSEFERHLETCRECASTLEAQESLRASLQRAQLREAAPAALRAKIRSSLPDAQPATSGRSHRGLQWIAVAAGIVVVMFVSWRMILPRQPYMTAGIGIEQVLDAHLRSLQPGHLTDVTSTDQHTVKPWFDGRLNFAPPVSDFSAEGFPLEGGRLDILNSQTVAALVYGRRKHLINVFVWPAEQRDSTFRTGVTRGYNWIEWRRGGMEFCAISDVAPADLRQLAELLSR
jgi:mycothiol system anti-sigma-R factor